MKATGRATSFTTAEDPEQLRAIEHLLGHAVPWASGSPQPSSRSSVGSFGLNAETEGVFLGRQRETGHRVWKRRALESNTSRAKERPHWIPW